jgi:hypothetical protein
VLHFARRVAFGVDVGDLLELERAFEAPEGFSLSNLKQNSSLSRAIFVILGINIEDEIKLAESGGFEPPIELLVL